jgi:hypothetical protein
MRHAISILPSLVFVSLLLSGCGGTIGALLTPTVDEAGGEGWVRGHVAGGAFEFHTWYLKIYRADGELYTEAELEEEGLLPDGDAVASCPVVYLMLHGYDSHGALDTTKTADECFEVFGKFELAPPTYRPNPIAPPGTPVEPD